MSTLTGKYEVKEVNGVNCAIAETACSRDRAEFLKYLLEHNGYHVEIEELPPPPPAEEGALVPEPLYTVGVTDITFNPALAIYSRELETTDGAVMLPSYWFTGKNGDEWYWKDRDPERLN